VILKYWIVLGVIAMSTVILLVSYFNYVQNISHRAAPYHHLFKVKEIYSTKPGGREWFIDMSNPSGDGIFDPGSQIKKQSDGS
jgi:hypothetical protein